MPNAVFEIPRFDLQQLLRCMSTNVADASGTEDAGLGKTQRLIRASMKMKMVVGVIALSAGVVMAQEKPADLPHEVERMDHGGFMQGGMHHVKAKGVILEQQMDVEAHTITVRVGPITLPANTDHTTMPQPPDVFWQIPVDGWLLSYSPQMVDSKGNEVPGRVLHHVAFWNENRADFLCPNKEEHIFGSGGEMNPWPDVQGFGYPIQKGNAIRIETMVNNPTATSYEKVYLEVTVSYQEAGKDAAAPASVKSYFPAWMDVQSCGNSEYDLKPGKNETTGTVKVKYAGELLGVGGHMHDYAKQLVLEDVTRKATVATLDAKVDDQGRLLGMTVATFFDRGGYPFAAGDELKITATYDNLTGKLIRDGAMGIAVGYFVPANVAALAALRRERPMANDMPGMSHDQ